MPEAPLRLHHAQFPIPRGQEAAGRTFYCGVLGLTEVEKPAALAGRGGFWLALGDLQLHVRIDDSDRHASGAHLAYEVSDRAAWRAQAVRRGLHPARLD